MPQILFSLQFELETRKEKMAELNKGLEVDKKMKEIARKQEMKTDSAMEKR